MIGEVYIDMLQPKLMARIVDEGILGINNSGTPDISLITAIGIRMILVVLAGGLCGMLSGVAASICSHGYGNKIRKVCFDRIMHLSFEQSDKFTTGSLITRITNDVSQVEALVQQLVRGFIRSLMFLVVGSMTLLSLNVHFLKVIAIALPLVLLDVTIILVKVSPLVTTRQTKLDKLNTVIQETIGGARVVKAFVQEKKEKTRFGNANEDLATTGLRVMLLISYLRPVMNIILNMATVALIQIGAVQVERGGMLPGEVMAAVTYITQILGGMMMLAMTFQMIAVGMASAKRLNEIIRAEPSIKGGNVTDNAEENAAPYDTESTELNALSAAQNDSPAISFKSVSFTYPEGQEEVLKGINLDIKRGETLAIVGSTGEGKTTLINLIDRFYDPTDGKVLINGIDVKDYNLTTLRDKISFVTQKNELFSTTIKENIAIGKPGATDEEIIKASTDAQAHDFIMAQENGYDTPVAEKGQSLSGGQRQRVAIARALLKHSEIMIFDDSSSALDLKTEANLYKALDEGYSDVTKVVIAQRIATAKYADRIAVIDDASIVALGTHEELYETSPIYKDICDSQMKLGGVA
ncbi:MAG: ABC transporter ATP-binding protein [Firmicutes bacterium]|nr:ABC transporter ATP-binding protein [Bacillota bacterium]